MKLITSACMKNANLQFKATITGLFLLIMSAAIFLFNPVKMFTDSQLSLRVGSLFYNLWLKPPIEVFITVHMFNVTNLEAFMNGTDLKLKVEEVGPYVYQEFLENHNVTFNENNTVTFHPRRTVKFVPERSVGDPKRDRIIAPNIPYMGVMSAASGFSAFIAMAVSALTKKLNSKAMLEISVHDYLWGYEDHLVHLASKVIPNVISFQRFGLMERMFDEGHNVVTIKLPDKKETFEKKKKDEREFSIDNWNGGKGIKFWDYDANAENTFCNALTGSYEGTLFPRNISKGETFYIYRKAFCRTLPIVYSHPVMQDGIEGYFFKLQDDAFDSDLEDPKSSCFCKGNKCLKKGLGNITPCYYNIPLAISFPHFFNGDPSLLEPLEGLKPDESKHGTKIIIQPQLGIPMKVESRFQINILMGNIKYNNEISRFANTVLPIFWLEIGVEKLTPGLIILIKLLFKVCPYVQLGLVLVCLTTGISLIGVALLCFWMRGSWNTSPSKNLTVCILPLLEKDEKLKELRLIH